MSENAKRAERGRQAVVSYGNLHYTCEEDPQAVVTDLLADIEHYCRRYGIDFEGALSQARDHVAAETSKLGL